MHYVKNVLPKTVSDYIIENGTWIFFLARTHWIILNRKNNNFFVFVEKFKCGPILEKLWEHPTFNPKDLKSKWKMFIRNLTQIQGDQYRRYAFYRNFNFFGIQKPVPRFGNTFRQLYYTYCSNIFLATKYILCVTGPPIRARAIKTKSKKKINCGSIYFPRRTSLCNITQPMLFYGS